MVGLTFGRDEICRRCKGTGRVGQHPCLLCGATGILRAPRRPEEPHREEAREEEEGDPFDADGATLEEARAWLRANVRRGVRCPCCQQFAKVYKRKLNAGIARALIVMWRRAGTDWLHKPTVLRGVGAAARDESIARYWGLLLEELRERPDGGRAGWWRITPRGEQFVRGTLAVPRYALIFDTRLIGMDGPATGIRDALGSRFDYDELMNA